MAAAVSRKVPTPAPSTYAQNHRERFHHCGGRLAGIKPFDRCKHAIGCVINVLRISIFGSWPMV
jgi:hypothetical protein